MDSRGPGPADQHVNTFHTPQFAGIVAAGAFAGLLQALAARAPLITIALFGVAFALTAASWASLVTIQDSTPPRVRGDLVRYGRMRLAGFVIATLAVALLVWALSTWIEPRSRTVALGFQALSLCMAIFFVRSGRMAMLTLKEEAALVFSEVEREWRRALGRYVDLVESGGSTEEIDDALAYLNQFAEIFSTMTAIDLQFDGPGRKPRRR